MWTAQTITITPEVNSTKMLLDFTLSNGTKTVDLSTTVSTVAEVKQAVQQNITRLNERDEAVAKAAAGTLLDESAPAEPTADELARKEWFEKYEMLKKGQPLVEMGIIQANDTRLTTLQTWLSTNFKTEYLDTI